MEGGGGFGRTAEAKRAIRVPRQNVFYFMFAFTTKRIGIVSSFRYDKKNFAAPYTRKKMKMLPSRLELAIITLVYLECATIVPADKQRGFSFYDW